MGDKTKKRRRAAETLSRREFLQLAGAGAVGVVAAACGSPTAAPTTAPPAATAVPAAVATKPPATAVPTVAATKAAATATTAVAAKAAVKYVGSDPMPTKFAESPLLADLVKAGKLPALAQRLPEKPLVVPVVDGIGQYGGTWRRGFLGAGDLNGFIRILTDSLIRHSPDGVKIEPKLIDSWSSNTEQSVWTLNMRKGAKWSDGTPFTADDILFWYNDVILNKDLTAAPARWILNIDRTVAKVEKVDDYTVRFTYNTTNSTFLDELANQDGADRSIAPFLPAKYLKQFHATYVAKDQLDKLVAGVGFKTWPELFAAKNAPMENPERPVMAAWQATGKISDPVLTFKRNPYFIGVDPQGNQLPYIDEIRFTFFSDTQSLNVAAVAGEFDEQERNINMATYPALKEASQKNGQYRVYLYPTFAGVDAYVAMNQTFKGDQAVADLLRIRDFRIAMSVAINRDQIRETAFLGLGEARQPVPASTSIYYPGDAVAKQFTQYDPAQANKLLDGIGLDKRDAQGYRLMSNGKRASIEIGYTNQFSNWGDLAQLIAKDWKNVGVEAILQMRDRTVHFQMRDDDTLMTEIWNDDSAAFPFIGSVRMDPRSVPGAAIGRGWQKWVNSGGKEGVEPPDFVKTIVANIDKGRLVTGDAQAALAKEMYTLWTNQQILIGTIGLSPQVQGVVVVSNKFMNVPATLGNDWTLRTPGNARTEQFSFKM